MSGLGSPSVNSLIHHNLHSTDPHSNLTPANTPVTATDIEKTSLFLNTLPKSTAVTSKTHSEVKHSSNSAPKTDIYKHYWRTIDNAKNVQLKLFSSYFDDRESPQVYVLGFENHDASHKYYCVLGYDDRTVCSDEPAARMNVNDDVDPFKDYDIALWGYYYTCKLPSPEVPTKVSITLNPECTLNSQEDWLPVLNREKKEKSEMRKFGACVQGPVYDVDDPQIVVEYMELHRSLGAEIITVYVQNAGPLVWKALQHYRDEGLVDLINWNLTFVEGAGYFHYRGQSLLVNECLFRNMYRVEYLAMNDLDEVIVPLGNSRTWSDMLPSLDAPGRGAFLFGHTTFTGDRQAVKEELLQCRTETGSSLKAIDPPRYMAKNKRFLKNGYEKFMVKPLSSKKISFHRIFGFLSGYSMYTVPKSVGLSYHFRDPPLTKSGRTFSDERLQTLFPEVLEKIRERLCSLYVDV